MYRNDSKVVDLLQCFFGECEQHFRFLEQSCGFNYISGLAEYRDNYKVIKPYHSQKVDAGFMALTRYEKGQCAIEILFGEEHFFLEGYIYFNRVQRFELSEILAAAKKNDRNIAGEWGLTEKTMITNTVKRISTALKDNIELYTRTDEKLLNRATIIRNKRIEQSVRKHFDTQIEEACSHAAKAFVDKDYGQVVNLLQPLAFYLNAGDLKKLRIAEKYVT